MVKPWNIKQIHSELKESYSQCNSEFERQNWRIFAAKDCKNIIGNRKPTPFEESILKSFGISLLP